MRGPEVAEPGWDAEYEARLRRLDNALETLPDKPEESALSTLLALAWLAAGRNLSAAEAMREEELPPLDDERLAALDDLIERRLSGIPLAHLTARQRFAGLELLTGPTALVPRRETELLAYSGIELARSVVAVRGSVRVADACTGCGNIALAIANHVPEATVVGADLSDESVDLANRNAAHLGLQHRVTFSAGDLLAPFTEQAGRIDVLTCNPPYISTAKTSAMATEISEHEPSMAFDGGPLGVTLLFRLIEDAPRLVRAGGWLAAEVGRGQGPGILKRLARAGAYTDIRGVEDDEGAVRVVVARVGC